MNLEPTVIQNLLPSTERYAAAIAAAAVTHSLARVGRRHHNMIISVVARRAR